MEKYNNTIEKAIGTLENKLKEFQDMKQSHQTLAEKRRLLTAIDRFMRLSNINDEYEELEREAIEQELANHAELKKYYKGELKKGRYYFDYHGFKWYLTVEGIDMLVLRLENEKDYQFYRGYHNFTFESGYRSVVFSEIPKEDKLEGLERVKSNLEFFTNPWAMFKRIWGWNEWYCKPITVLFIPYFIWKTSGGRPQKTKKYHEAVEAIERVERKMNMREAERAQLISEQIANEKNIQEYERFRRLIEPFMVAVSEDVLGIMHCTPVLEKYMKFLIYKQ